MKFFHPPKPCNNCPFRREGGIRLYADRIAEIAAQVAPADGQGSSFTCHKTVDYDERKPDQERMCTGALVFAYKLGISAQLTRICERLGQIDPALADSNRWPEIFDTLEEMLDTAIKPRVARRKALRAERKAVRKP